MSHHRFYHTYENGAGPALLLLHGFTGSSDNWAELTPRLSRRFRVIRVDLPGHGKTAAAADHARGALPAVAADLAAVLAEHDATPAHVLGYSMGARLALGLALLHPHAVATLMLESGSPGLASAAERAARRDADEALAERIERNGIVAFVDEWERLPLWESQRSLPEATRRRLRERRLRCDPAGLAASLRQMGTGAQPSFWDDLGRLQVPTLLITGALDAKFGATAAAMRAQNPAFEHQIVAGAGHTPHLEQPAAWLELVERWLAVEGERSAKGGSMG